MFSRQLVGYPSQVLVRRVGEVEESEPADCKWLTQLLPLIAHEDMRVLLSVEGEDAAAVRLAKRLYGGLTSRYAFDMKWDRFDSATSR